MDKAEQFVNIDLNDDNICSVCKLETDTGTMSFCHVCFELSIEGERVKWGGGYQITHFSYNSYWPSAAWEEPWPRTVLVLLDKKCSQDTTAQ